MASKGSTNTDRVWEIIETVGIAMLTTSFPGGLRARPVEARPERDAGLIWFVTDLRSGKEHEIEAEHDVGLVFIDAKAKAYLSITARAEVRRDHAKAAEIWKRSDNMWWKGPDDPERLRIARAPSHRRAVGRPGERRRRRVRIRQGTHHRREAEPRREPQGDSENDKSCCPAQIRDPRTKTAEHGLPDHLEGNPRPQADRLQLWRSSARGVPAHPGLQGVRRRSSIRVSSRRRELTAAAAREANGAASISMASRTFRCAKAPGVAAPGTARHKPASSLSMSTSTCRKR